MDNEILFTTTVKSARENGTSPVTARRLRARDISRALPTSHVDGVRRLPARQRVRERHDVRCDISEDLPQNLKELVFGRVVRPECEHTLLRQMPGERTQTCRRVEGGMTGVKDVIRGVVDIQKDRVEPIGKTLPESPVTPPRAQRNRPAPGRFAGPMRAPPCRAGDFAGASR